MIIKRARGFRLYTVEGKKILDLSMDWGRAVIGHRPNGLSLTIKNVIERGLYAGYNNIYEHRLTKELKKRFPEYEYITYLEYEQKVQSYFNCNIADPIFEDVTGKVVSYYRPFFETPTSDNIVVLYPLPGLNSTTVLLSKIKPDLKSDSISPIILSGILRSLYDFDKDNENFKIDSFNVYNNIPNTTLKAPYLIFNLSDEDYKILSKKALDNDILLNDREKFAVLSIDLSHGEIKKIVKTLS